MRNKENEIEDLKQQLRQKEQVLPSSTRAASTERLQLRPKTSHGTLKPLNQPNDIKRYYEAEFSSLNKQTKHFQKILNEQLDSEQKLQLLHSELQLLVQFNMKKSKMIENRLKALADEDIGQPIRTSESEPSNEISENKLITRSFRELSEGSTRLMTSHSSRRLRNGPGAHK